MDGTTNTPEVEATTNRSLGASSRKSRFTKVAKKKKSSNPSITGDPPKGSMIEDNT